MTNKNDHEYTNTSFKKYFTGYFRGDNPDSDLRAIEEEDKDLIDILADDSSSSYLDSPDEDDEIEEDM